MSKKKSKPVPASPAKPAAASTAKRGSMTPWIIGAAIAVFAIGLFMSMNGKGGTATALKPTAEEAKYIGRYLPAGYEEPKVAEAPGKVTADTPMSPIAATQTTSSVTLPVAEVTSKKIVGFTYQKAGAPTPLALVAYVKPSGKLVVAVSYCVPCKGTTHSLTTDGAVTCGACGTKRDAETGVGISGSCKLYPLDEVPVTVDGDNIVIPADVLDSWTEQPLDRQVG